MILEKVKKHSRSTLQEASATIGKQKIIYLNTFTMNTHFKNVQNVNLFSDSTSRKIVIKSAPKNDPDGFALGHTNRKRQSTGFVSARHLINNLLKKLRTESIKVKKTSWDEKDQSLLIEY